MYVTGLILLGASTHDHWPSLDRESFKTSYLELRQTISTSRIYESGRIDILDLFNSKLSPSDLVNTVVDFIDKSSYASIILYYCGHGELSGDRRSFMLVPRSIREGSQNTSSIKIQDLWNDLKASVSDKRLYVILDACYSGEAHREFMSADVSVVVEEAIRRDLPPSGVSVISATHGRDVALSPNGSPTTLFTGALVEIIKNGIKEHNDCEFLSWDQIVEQIKIQTKKILGNRAPVPKIIATAQQRGDINKIPFFRNSSFSCISTAEVPSLSVKSNSTDANASDRESVRVSSNEGGGAHDSEAARAQRVDASRALKVSALVSIILGALSSLSFVNSSSNVNIVSLLSFFLSASVSTFVVIVFISDFSRENKILGKWHRIVYKALFSVFFGFFIGFIFSNSSQESGTIFAATAITATIICYVVWGMLEHPVKQE